MNAAVRKAARACDALGLASDSATLVLRRGPERLRATAVRADERASAILAAARHMRASGQGDAPVLQTMIDRAEAASAACCDLIDMIDAPELATAS